MPKWNNDFQAWEPDEIDSAAEFELLLKPAAGNANTSDKPSTLFHAELAEREFSSRVFRVPDLLQWADAQGLTIDTEPDIRAFEFVQAEALLAAIERKVGSTVTPEQARELVASDPDLSLHQQASDPILSRWLLGAEAHRQWRHLLVQAIENGELRLLDFASKLPIAPQAAAPEPAAAGTAKKWTPEALRALSDYRERHGTKEAAEHFGISAARVRGLLPSEKKTPAKHAGVSVFTHRIE